MARLTLLMACLFLVVSASFSEVLSGFDKQLQIHSINETVSADQASQYYWSDRYQNMTVVCLPGSGGSVDFEINMNTRDAILASPTTDWIKAYTGAADETVAYLVEGEVTAVRCYANTATATLWIRAK